MAARLGPAMRLTLPTRFPMQYVLSFAAALFAIELVEGTTVVLALSTQAFLIVSALAFNIAGGMAYPSGMCIFFNAFLSLILGALVKACLGEPLQTNLIAPERTIPAYLAGITSILVAVYFSTKLRSKRGLLESVDVSRRIDQIGMGCILIAFVTPFLIPSALQGTFAQFNSAFVYLAILLPVYDRTRQTDGRRSFHPVALLGWIYLTGVYGILGSSKQGLFTPSVAWAVGAIAAGYRITVPRLALVVTCSVTAILFLTPYSQIVRNYQGLPNQGEMSWHLLTHPVETRALYNESQRYAYEFGTNYHWFDEPQGLLDRLTTVPVDDALLYSTDHLRPGTPLALWSYVLNMVPRYLYPGKPNLRWGNVYAHDIGLIGEEDDITGISFSPYADGYHTAGWLGVTLYLGLFFFAMFLVCDSVAGSVARTQWGLIYLLFFAHASAEGMLNFTTYAISTTSVALICAALISTYIAPVVGGLVLPGGRAAQRA